MRLWALRGALLLTTAMSAVGAGDAAAATFTVTNTNNSGGGSLRQAITDANNAAGADTITFSISPGTAPFTITPTSALPSITGTATIDATTQPSFNPLTPRPVVELNGTSAGSTSDGLTISAANTTVRGLAINRFRDGIHVLGANAAVIKGNYLGTDPAGALDLGNTRDGIDLNTATNAVIGGTSAADRNLISGNNVVGVVVNGTGHSVKGNYIGTNETGTAAVANGVGVQVLGGGVLATNNSIGGTAAGEGNLISGNTFDGVLLNTIGVDKVQSNLIQGNHVGTAADGTSALGNGGSGIAFDASGGVGMNTVGGAAAGAGNVIAFNSQDGVAVGTGTTREDVSRNRIFSNSGLGIDLGVSGITSNDADDPDAGANNLQNFPVLSEVTNGSSATDVSGTLNSEPSKTYRLEFFSSPSCDTSGNGEGDTFLGATNATTDAGGDASFDTALSADTATGDQVTATATDPNGNTSEFSACETIAGPQPATVTGTKFHDQNHDGEWQQPDEPGLVNWTIRAYEDENANQQLDAGETTIAASDVTGANGDYSLTVEAGDYLVCEVAKAGWAQSLPSVAAPTGCTAIAALADGGHPLALDPGEEASGANFGNYQPNVIGCTPEGDNDVVEADPPADLRLGQYESNQCMFLFDEQQDVTLSSGLVVDSSPVRGTGGVATLPAGSELTSHVLHADKVGNTGQLVTFDGSYTFSEPVVGLIWTGNRLNSTDNQLGIPGDGQLSGIDYEASATAREFESTGGGPGSDTATVSPDGHTVTFHTGQTIGADEVRVLTGTVPPPATVTGTKFHDQNHDGEWQQPDEPGLVNWTIRAYEDENANQQLDAGETTIAASDVTGANGDYSLTVEAGDYLVCEVAKAGWAQSLPSVAAPTGCTAIAALADGGHPLALDPGEEASGANFGNYQPNVIGCTPEGDNDVVEADPPADLRLGQYESNQCMFLFDEQQDVTLSSGLVVDSSPVRGTGGVATLPAGSELTSHVLHADKVGNTGQLVTFDGSYTFSEPVVGLIWTGNRLNSTDNQLGIPGDGQLSGIDYEASATAREFESTGGGPGSDTATVSPDGHTVTFHTGQTIGADEVRVLTGTVPPPATVRGVKFDDVDGNGQADGDPADPGLPNWTIRAYVDTSGDGVLQSGETTVAGSAVTDSGGAYELTLDPGRYVLCEVAKTGWAQTAPGGGACAAIGGVADGGHVLNLDPAVELTHLDFGNQVDDTWMVDNEQRWCKELTLWRNLATQPCAGRSQLAPPGNIDMANGQIKLSGGANTLAFPYLWTKDGAFGTTGDFVLEVRMRYDSIAPHGDGLLMRPWADATPSGGNSPLPTGEDRCATGQVWAGSALGGPRASLLGIHRFPTGGRNAFHTYTFEYVDGEYALFVDGQLLIGPIPSSRRADRLWLGNPVFFYRGGDWSDTTFDYVTISQPTTIDADGDGIRDSQEAPVNVPAAALQDDDGDGLPNHCDPVPPRNGTIIVQKNTDPDQSSQEFDFSGEVPGSISDGETLTKSVPAGTYTVTESATPGWRLSRIGCDDSDSHGNVANRTATFAIASNETVTCDFDNSTAADITGTKWNDRDADGVRDAGEGGIADWEIRAYVDADSSGKLESGEDELAAATETNLDGDYSLSVDPDRDYVVCEVARTAWEQTAPVPGDGECGTEIEDIAAGGHAVSPDPAGTSGGNHFGNRRQRSPVTGTKWNDRDADGVRDAGEGGIADWEIRAYVDADSSGKLESGEDELAAATETNLDGDYSLSVDPDRDYVVCEVARTAWEQTAPVPGDGECGTEIEDIAAGGHAVSPDPGQTSGGNDFGNFTHGDQPGLKFEDLNGDGARQTGEDPLPGWEISAYADDGDGTLSATEAAADPAATETTDAQGLYNLELDPGAYVVCEASKLAPPLWRQSAPDNQRCAEVAGAEPGGHPATASSGSSLDEADFGNYRPGERLGIKFEDANADGVRGAGEGGLSGWTIRAYRDDGDGTLAATETTVGAEVTTTAGGAFDLDLAPGDYVVCEVSDDGPPAWHQSAPQNQRCAAIADAEGVEPGGHVTRVVSGDESRGQLSFGNFTHGDQPGLKFEDLNGDGARQTGEDPLPGWEISAYADDGDGTLSATEAAADPAATETTDAQGLYNLELDPGAYVVCEASKLAPPLWRQSAPDNQRCAEVAGAEPGGHPATASSGSSLDEADFGNYIEDDPEPTVTLDKTQQNLTTGGSPTNGHLDVQLGDRIRYSLVLSNGTVPFDDVRVADRLSNGASTVRLSPQQVDPRCTASPATEPPEPPEPPRSGTMIRCSLDLAANEDAVLVIEAKVVDSRCTIVGTRGNNSLAGTRSVDTVCGAGGADTSNGGLSDDDMYGDQPLPIDASEMKNKAWFDTDGNQTVTGTEMDSLKTVTANQVPSDDRSDTYDGAAGNDDIWGQDDGDTLNGADGIDSIRGEGGVDVIDGDAANDLVNGGVQGDILRGDGGADQVLGEDGNDRIFGGTGNDPDLSGGDGSDDIAGDDGKDVANGEQGVDTVTGQTDGDRLSGGSEDDVVNGDAGVDTVAGNSGSDTLRGGTEADEVFGQGDADTVDGGSGSDGNLSGGDGNDLILGDEGADVMLGGPDSDRIQGYFGSDEAQGGPGADSIAGEGDRDTIFGQDGNDCFNFPGHTACPTSTSSFTAGSAGSGPFRPQLNGGGLLDEVSGGAGVDRVDGGESDYANVLNGGADGPDYCSFGHSKERRISCELP